jgi:hypothetical protein
MGIKYRVRSYLRKPMVRKRLDAHIRTIVVLSGGKANSDLLSAFAFCNLFFCNDASTDGKKVSIFPSGDVCHVYYIFL